MAGKLPTILRVDPEIVDEMMRNMPRDNGSSGGINALTTEQKELMYAYIIDLVRKGCSNLEINHILAERWNICRPTARKYKKMAYAWMAQGVNEGKEQVREKSVERVELILEKALEEGDLKSALKAMEILNTLNALDSKNIVDLNINGVDFKFGDRPDNDQ